MITYPLGQPTSPAQPVNASVAADGMLSWQNAKAKSQLSVTNPTPTPAVLGIIGASITGGNTIANILTQSYFANIRSSKQGSYSTNGDTFPPLFSASWNSANNMGATPPFTHSVAPTLWAPTGPLWVAAYSQTGTSLAAPLFFYTHPTAALGYRALSFRIFYWDPGTADGGAGGNSATWQFNLNGGAAQTVTLSPNGANCLIRFVDVTSATPGWANQDNQVLNFGNQSANSSCQIIAIASYSATSPTAANANGGIHYVWFGMAGLCMGDLAFKGNAQPSDKMARFKGPSNAAAPFTANAALSPPFAFDGLILDALDDLVAPNTTANLNTTPNTKVTLLSASAYRHALRELTDAVRSKPTGCSVLHHIPSLPVGVVSDVNSSPLQLENREHYADVVRGVAGTRQSWVDSDETWHDNGFTSGFQPNNSPHPTPLGMQNISGRMLSSTPL